MLHQIGKELEARLVAKGCPYKVVDREPRGVAVTYKPRIVIESDGDDKFGPPRGLSTNPKKHYTRKLSCKLTIYGKSLKPGALEHEHKQVVEQVLDLVLVGMRYVAADRLNAYELGGGRFVTPPDLDKSEVNKGAAYELKFTFDRAVSELNWAGEIFPETEIGTVETDVRVTQAPGPIDEDEPPAFSLAASGD
jgi:hypothetical protein